MKIYVAGEVPRERPPTGPLKSLLGLSEEPSPSALMKIYRQIEDAATAFTVRRIELKMPYPDPKVDGLGPKEFVEYLRDKIGQSDGVLTVFCPPGIAVGFEAHLASELRKPQTILVPRSLRVPRYLSVLPYVVKVDMLEEVRMSGVLRELTQAVLEMEDGR